MKFYEFKNITQNEADLYIYGEIVQEKSVDWWAGEESSTEIGLMDFKEKLDSLGNVNKLNLYINSPGGDVFVASTMISMLKRLKQNGTVIDAYVDGLSASAASFLMMVADNINLYKNSVVMIHKPMTFSYGNANDMQQDIDRLNKIEDSVMLPMYMDKAKISEEEVKQLINDESWLNAEQMSEYFNVNILDEEKIAVACANSKLFKNYKHVPEYVKNLINNKEKTKNNHLTNKKLDDFFIEESKEKSSDVEDKKLKIKAKLGLIRNSLLIQKINRIGDDFNE